MSLLGDACHTHQAVTGCVPGTTHCVSSLPSPLPPPSFLPPQLPSPTHSLSLSSYLPFWQWVQNRNVWAGQGPHRFPSFYSLPYLCFFLCLHLAFSTILSFFPCMPPPCPSPTISLFPTTVWFGFGEAWAWAGGHSLLSHLCAVLPPAFPTPNSPLPPPALPASFCLPFKFWRQGQCLGWRAYSPAYLGRWSGRQAMLLCV